MSLPSHLSQRLVYKRMITVVHVLWHYQKFSLLVSMSSVLFVIPDCMCRQFLRLFPAVRRSLQISLTLWRGNLRTERGGRSWLVYVVLLRVDKLRLELWKILIHNYEVNKNSKMTKAVGMSKADRITKNRVIGIANLKIVYRNCYEDTKAGRLLNWSGLRAVFNWLSKNQTKVILGTNQNKGLHNH